MFFCVYNSMSSNQNRNPQLHINCNAHALQCQVIVCRKYAVSILFHGTLYMQACKDHLFLNLMCCCCCDGACCQASLLPIPRIKKSDEPAGSSLDHPEPLVSFALCYGSRSSPVVSPSHPRPYILQAAASINTLSSLVTCYAR